MAVIGGLLGGCLLVVTAFLGCVQKAPPELVQELESLDRQLVEGQGAEFAPEEYGRFITHWVALKGRLGADEDQIRWPWEPDTLTADLRQIRQEGLLAASVAAERREAGRLGAEARLQALERRWQRFTSSVDDMGSRVVLGQRPMETELLTKQARTFFQQGLYNRSLTAIEEAAQLMDDQAATLARKLGRYADEQSVAAWRRM